jgi:hypothetical protein
MPVAYADIPAGMNDGAKKKIFQELYEEIHQAWPIPDTRVLIREWPNQAVSQDGRIENVPMRPICTLAVPPGLEHDAKHRLVRQISNTIRRGLRPGSRGDSPAKRNEDLQQLGSHVLLGASA